MNNGDIENTFQVSFYNECENDFLDMMEKYVLSSDSFNDLHSEYQVNIEDLREIVKSNNILLETKISNSQKQIFINYMKNFYLEYFDVKETRIEKYKLKETKNSAKRLKSKNLAKKQKVLSKLQNGFENNVIGAFERLRTERIKKLQDDLNLLKKMGKNSKEEKSKSQYKKPIARIIYTPMGGKVE